MPRKAEPRWYESRGGWYAWIDGRQCRLAVGEDAKAEAWREFNRLMLEGPGRPRGEKVTATVLFDLLLEWVEKNREPLTYRWYKRHLQAASDAFGQAKAEDLTPADVRRWLDRTKWAGSTKHGAIAAVKRAYRWGRREGYIDRDPMESLEKPGIATRESILTGEQVASILAAVDGPFRDLLTILHETGMRPSEAYRLTAKDVDWERSHVLFARHKTRRKDARPRVVYLTPAALALLRRLADARPGGGPLLRNKAGNRWTDGLVCQRFNRLRKRLKLGKEATADSFRHLFITDGLENGVPIATVAQLAGHRSTAMIERHYGHLHERGKHLLEAVGRVRNARPPEPPTTDVQGCPEVHPTDLDTRS